MAHTYNLRKRNGEKKIKEPRILSIREENLRKRKRPEEEGSRKKQKLYAIPRCSVCYGEGLDVDGECTIGTCEICDKTASCYDCIGTTKFERKYGSCEECFIVACQGCLIHEEKGSYCVPCFKRMY